MAGGMAAVLRAEDAPVPINSNAAPAWVVPAIPKPDSAGWITLFDGEQLHGCNPTNKGFTTGKVFIQNGVLWFDTMGTPLQLKSLEVALRVQVKKVSGQNFCIWFGRDTAWFNGGRAFGIFRTIDHHYETLKTGNASADFNDFFEMELLSAGGKLVLMADGKPVVTTKDSENKDENAMGMYALKGISMVKRIEVKLSDVQSLFPKDETATDTQTKPDAGERLKKLKSLYDQGLINKEDYDKKVKEIMDAL